MSAFEHSPLDAVHRALGAKMVPFGGWEMPLSYPTGTIDEHLACRNDAVVFDVSHLGTVRVEGADAAERLQRALTNDLRKIAPGRAQYTHLLDEADASVLDDIIVWWVDDEVFDVMPNASNTDRVRSAIGGNETTHDRAVLAVQGPRAKERLATVFPEAAAVGRFRGQPRSRGRASTASSPAPATRARPASRSPCPTPRRRPVDGDHRRRCHAGRARARATRCASRPGCRCTATSWAPASRRCRPGLGWVVAWSKGDVPRPRAARGRASCGRQPPARWGSPPTAGARRAPTARCSSTITRSAMVTSGNFSPVLGHGIALAFLPPDTEVGTAVVVDVRGTALAGRVVPTPFVPKH